MGERLGPSGSRRRAVDGAKRDGGVVDDAVGRHFGDRGVLRPLARRHKGEMPGELLFPGRRPVGRIDPDIDCSHVLAQPQAIAAPSGHSHRAKPPPGISMQW